MGVINPEQEGGSSGGGPRPEPDRPIESVLRSRGFFIIYFGIAMALTLTILYLLLLDSGIDFLSSFHNYPGERWWLAPILGFLGGLLVAFFYNLFVLRRLKLFGLEIDLQ
jgi:H+/Cl- antiporter ClcA